jgi:D-alanine-D-alanine ligase
MKKSLKHIEIVRTRLPGLSSMSQESCDALFAVLTKNYTTVGVTYIHNFQDLRALVDRHPDLVFLGMKFIPRSPELGRDDPDKIWITDYLDEHGISYTGSGPRAHNLELNKPLAKQRVLDYGLRTSPFFVAEQNQPLSVPSSLKFPLFVKPTNRGGGLGIDGDSVVYTRDGLKSKVSSIAGKHQSDALVEAYLPGREFSVAILKDEFSEDFAIMPIELSAPSDNQGISVLSEKVKSSNAESVSPVSDEIIKEKVGNLAINVFHALGARDYGRIDIRMDEANEPHFLEANLLPSLISGYGSFPKACSLNLGLDYEPMILHIVRLALARKTDLVPETVIDDAPHFHGVGFAADAAL